MTDLTIRGFLAGAMALAGAGCASVSVRTEERAQERTSAVAGIEDANLRDFPRHDGETDDSPRFMRAVASAPNGVLVVPKGDYMIASMLKVTNRCSLLMHPAARLLAVKKMPYVLFWDGNADYHALSVFDEKGELYDNQGLFIKGGDIDGRGLASCLALANSHHFTLRDTVLHNGARTGLCVTRETGGHLYELVAENVYCKTTMSGLAGNVGIECLCADNHFVDCIVVDYTVSIRDCGGGNRFQRCHVWGGTVPPKGMSFREWSEYYAMVKKLDLSGKFDATAEKRLLEKGLPEMLKNSIAFDIKANDSIFDGCYADTAEIGYNVGGSTTIHSSGFYNNLRMGLRKSTAIVHSRGSLIVSGCTFNGRAKVEKLYEGSGKGVVWRDVRAFGGADMAKDSAKLAASAWKAH